MRVTMVHPPSNLSEPKRSQGPNDSECLQQPYADCKNHNDMNDAFDGSINREESFYNVQENSHDD